MRRRIRNAKIIQRLNDPTAEKMKPDAVRMGFGEEWIIRAGHPIRERDEFIAGSGSWLAKKPGPGRCAGLAPEPQVC